MQIFNPRVITLASITVFFCGTALSAVPLRTQYFPYSQINLQSKFPDYRTRIIGFTRQGTFVISILKRYPVTSGKAVYLNTKTAKTTHSIDFSRSFAPFFLTLSSKGSWLISAENIVDDPSIKYNNAHLAVIRPSARDSSNHTINIGAKNGIMGVLTSSEDDSQVILRMDSLFLSGNKLIYGKNRLLWLNLKTGRIDKTLIYHPANEVDSLFFSPNRKYLLGLFYSEAFNPYGESDYTPLKNQFERHGFVDVIDPTNGKILWHLEGTDKQPVGDPLFFISPTRFISSDTVFNIATKTARPWNAITPTRKCLAAVPGHPNTAMFLTPSGLQLRDWQKDKLLVSWPTVKQPGRIMFSPDLKMFSFKRGAIIQFWKFDPKWLK